MNQAAGASDLASAYHEADRDVRLHNSRVGCWLALVLVPLFWGLDWLFYPAWVWELLAIRLLCDVAVAAVLGLLYTPFGRRCIRVLGISWALLPGVAIAAMIALTEGAASTYYAGLNLVMITVCLLMPWTFGEVVITCCITIGLYIAACVIHAGGLGALAWPLMLNRLHFIIATAVICATSSIFTARRRFEEFRLRHELDTRNRELGESYRQLEEMDQLKSEFFANVSHELRTPLTLVLSPIERLLHREPPLPSEAGEALVLAKNNGLRLLRLINDLLEIIRLEEGRLELRKSPLELATFLPGMAEGMRHLAERKGVTLTAEPPGPDAAPLVVQADAGRLEKVLMNLLSNAVKFTPAGGSITVRWERVGDAAHIEVEDTGVGIPARELPRVFDRFRQVDGSSTRKHQGTGLGLALAKELVEQHDGTLSVRSTEDVGTTFTIELPVHEGPAEEPAESSHTAEPAPDPITEASREAERAVQLGVDTEVETKAEDEARGDDVKRVLVVDDEPDMRRFLASILTEEYRVIQAADGETGLEAAREHRPDAILLDMMLPGMDGLDVCRGLRRDETLRDVRILLLTARMDEGTKIEALSRGADDFLTKPFSSIEVRTRLQNLLRTAALQRDLRDRNQELEQTLTELRETESRLIQSEKMNALGSLAAGLLHEINNPLNYTLTALQFALQSAGDDEDLKETLGDIDEGMQRIRDIVSDLRAFAYPERAEQQQPFDVNDAVETAMRFTARSRNGLLVERDLNAPCRALGSRSHITQVLVNLLSNAQRAVEQVKDQRTPCIRVHAERRDGRLIVGVRDNGVGIDPEVRGRVFDPFFTTRDVGEGTGLGLSICHTIIKNHGGSIDVQSEKGRWTEVIFDLPLAETEA